MDFETHHQSQAVCVIHLQNESHLPMPCMDEGRRDPVTPVRLRESFLPFYYDLSPSLLSEVNRETLSPPLSVNRN